MSPDTSVSFGQLLGMCDHLTYSLAASKFRAFKYIPYGPVNEVRGQMSPQQTES